MPSTRHNVEGACHLPDTMLRARHNKEGACHLPDKIIILILFQSSIRINFAFLFQNPNSFCFSISGSGSLSYFGQIVISNNNTFQKVLSFNKWIISSQFDFLKWILINFRSPETFSGLGCPDEVLAIGPLLQGVPLRFLRSLGTTWVASWGPSRTHPCVSGVSNLYEMIDVSTNKKYKEEQ